MKHTHSPLVKAEPIPPVPSQPQPWLKAAGFIYLAILLLGFASTLYTLTFRAAVSQLHSYILLIPFISGYLIYIQRERLPKVFSPSVGLGSIFAIMGLLSLSAALTFGPWSANDYFTLMALSFVCLLVAGGFFFLGQQWMVAAAFPVAFLFFFVPMPDAMADTLEIASQVASAEAASVLFSLSGTPFIHEGTILQLPNITIRVAQECSGIRSSWILLITSLLASYLFLKTPWRRAVLVVFVIPLGILRNGFRILVIGLLCVHYGPEMIHSVIHRRGGPFFFALSLFPLFLLLCWLRSGKGRRSASVPTAAEP